MTPLPPVPDPTVGTLVPITQTIGTLMPVSNDRWADPEVPAGVINGTDGTDGNPTFTLLFKPAPQEALDLFKNALHLTQGLAYTLSDKTITYLTGYIPITGDTHETGAYRF